MTDNRNRDRYRLSVTDNTDTAIIITGMEPVLFDIIIQPVQIAEECLFPNDILMDLQKISFGFYPQIRIPPAVSIDDQRISGSGRRIFYSDLRLFGKKLYRFLFVDLYQKLFHIVFVPIKSGKSFIGRIMLSVVSFKDLLKFPAVKESDRFRPAAFRKICKMKKILDRSKA